MRREHSDIYVVNLDLNANQINENEASEVYSYECHLMYTWLSTIIYDTNTVMPSDHHHVIAR